MELSWLYLTFVTIHLGCADNAQVHGGEGHEHHNLNQGENFLQDSNIIHDKEHLQSHLDGVIDKKPDEMTPEEQQFHYFQLHDTDNDMKLDGIEILHTIRESFSEDSAAEKQSDAQLIEWVDNILKSDDKNHDGYVDWPEFMSLHTATQTS